MKELRTKIARKITDWMNGDKSITEEQFKAFEEIQMEAERLPLPPKKEPKEAV